MYQLTQDITEQGYIQNAKKTLFADAFNTAVNNNIEVFAMFLNFLWILNSNLTALVPLSLMQLRTTIFTSLIFVQTIS